MAEQADLSTPNPDPTVLTTAALYREVGGLRELLEQRISSLGLTINARLNATEQVFSEKLAAWQTSIKGQFEIIERQRVEQKTDTKQALDAALQAAKDAVALQTEASDKAIAKSETATNKALDQLGITFAAEMGSIRRELGELKDRVNEEGRNSTRFSSGITGAQTQSRESSATVIAIGMGVLGIAAIASSIVIAITAQ